MEVDFIFSIVILIMSVVVHEVSHGYTAYLFGDPTAKLAGRLTLNPFKHLDLQGSLIIPAIAYYFTGFIFGWAKPVPYNPYNLKNAKVGEPMVALAGPLSNFLVAIIFGVLIRFSGELGLASDSFIKATGMIVLINLVLGLFNLIPIPPLDGSKVLFGILPHNLIKVRYFLEENYIWLILFFIFFLWKFLTPVISLLFFLITGVGL